MPGELHELSLAIGRLQSDVESLSESVKEEREGAARHRRDLRDVISSLSQSVRTLADKVADMQPVVEELRAAREQARGAAAYRKWIWGAIFTAGGFLASLFLDIARMVGVKPPHP